MTNNSQLSKCYNNEAIRKIEKLAFGSININDLMERAGKAVFQFIRSRYSSCSILVFCGSGNNGGDGYVAARLAHEHGYQVSIIWLGSPRQLPEPALTAYKRCQKAGISIKGFDNSIDYHADLIVDGLLGIGLSREIKGKLLEAVNFINVQKCPVISIDVPSGINSDTGSIMGSAIKADHTITLIANKIGILTNDAVDCIGELLVDCLELKEDVFNQVEHSGEIIQKQNLENNLIPRNLNTHKGDYGHVVIVGGSKGMAGAVMMAARAAFKVGVGRVTIITEQSHTNSLFAYLPEAMVYPFDESFAKHLNTADVVVFGSGMTNNSWSKQVWDSFDYKGVTVLDAGGLRLLSRYPKYDRNYILTPHPGEAADLLKLSEPNLIQKDRFKAIRDIAKKYQATVILKGAGSIICDQNSKFYISRYGNPWMATAGTGDVLSGIIGGYLANGYSNIFAAKLGVMIHALAGDQAAQGRPKGLMATDLIEKIREVINI